MIKRSCIAGFCKLTKLNLRDNTEAAVHGCSLGSILKTRIEECTRVSRLVICPNINRKYHWSGLNKQKMFLS